MREVDRQKSHFEDPGVREAESGVPGASSALTLDAQLCFQMYSGMHAMNRVYKRLLDPLGLTYPQYLVMLVLWECDGVTVSGLGERLGLDSGTLTPLLRRMAAKGWLDRQRDERDERRVVVRLTDAGRALKQTAAGVPKAMLCAMGMDVGEMAALREQLRRLRGRLAEAEQQSP